MKISILTYFTILLTATFVVAIENDIETTIGGAGWFQFGRVQESWVDPKNPNNNNAYNKNWMQDAGAVLNVKAKVSEHWSGALEVGAIQVHLARGSINEANKWYAFWVPFVGFANISYLKDNFNFTLGVFQYSYGPDNKNLGLYLMNGYVYPGTLVSPHVGPLDPLKPLFGTKLSYSFGNARNDLLINIETVDKPLYDISIADYFNYKIMDGFDIGAGINFYRLIPQNSSVTSPSKHCAQGPYANGCAYEDTTYIFNPASGLNDSISLDTITGSLAGTKLVARFSFDPKPMLGGIKSLGESDLTFYGELAILGLKNYPQKYPDIKNRIPFMFGFNFPTFGLFNLAAEVEYYASNNSSDNLAAQNGSWIPVTNDNFNHSRDNFKWAFIASKVLFGHMALMGQVANDNLRLGGSHDTSTGVLTTLVPTDWYWTTKLAYFF